jgi:peptide/nickel transport system substrate-binding protein/oligopeptide transport system substrate-binding protein
VLVAAQIFDGLVETDPVTGEVLPAAAERWAADEGGRRLTFQLGESRFHDGSPVRAQDFVFAWARLVDPTRTFPLAFLLEDVQGFEQHRLTFGADPFDGVRALNDRTLEVRLREPNAGFLALLAHPALSPVPPFADSPRFANRPVGNGPYRLVEDLGLDTPIRLLAAEQASVPIPQVEFRPFEEPQEGWPEFLSGELDLAEIPSSLIEQVAPQGEAPGVHPLGRLLYCGFNLSSDRFPRALRTAVSIGIDRASLVRGVYGSAAAPADGIVPPTFPGYRPGACGDRCAFDADRAKELVESVPERRRAFRLDFPLTEVGEELAATLSEALAEIGLEATPQGHDEADYARLLRREGQEAFCLVWVADAPTSQELLEPILDSGSADNHTNLDDRRVDTLLGDARARTDPTQRAELYGQVEAEALEQMPLVPLAWFRSRVAAQPYISGLTVDPLGRFEVSAVSVIPD